MPDDTPERRQAPLQLAKDLKEFTASFETNWAETRRQEHVTAERRAARTESILKDINNSQAVMKAEYGQRFDNIDKTHRGISEVLQSIRDTLTDIDRATVVNTDNINTLKTQSREHYSAMNKNENRITTAETKLKLMVPEKKPSSAGSTSSAATMPFLMSSNGRVALIILLVIAIGFFGVLGIQIAPGDIAKMKP